MKGLHRQPNSFTGRRTRDILSNRGNPSVTASPAGRSIVVQGTAVPRTRFTPHLRVANAFGVVRTAHPLPSGALYTREALACHPLIVNTFCTSPSGRPHLPRSQHPPSGAVPSIVQRSTATHRRSFHPPPAGSLTASALCPPPGSPPTFPAANTRRAGPSLPASCGALPRTAVHFTPHLRDH